MGIGSLYFFLASGHVDREMTDIRRDYGIPPQGVGGVEISETSAHAFSSTGAGILLWHTTVSVLPTNPIGSSGCATQPFW